jgi:hypothetical protein
MIGGSCRFGMKGDKLNILVVVLAGAFWEAKIAGIHPGIPGTESVPG